MDTSRTLSIIIPALNEEAAIANTISAIPKSVLEQSGYEVQILVVDNGSQDNTADSARKAGAEVVFEQSRGYGKALKRGFANAKGNIIVTVDADASYPVEDIPRLVEILENKHIDFLTTNRLVAQLEQAMSTRNRIGNSILALATRVLFGLNIKDAESGMMVFRRHILDNLRLRSDTWPFSHELKIEACYYNKHPWTEIPIEYRMRIGRTKLLNAWKVGFIDLAHLIKKRLVR